MTRGGRVLSLAHLCMIEVPPVDLVRAAANSGFDAVGIRLVPTSDGVDHGVLGNPRRMAELSMVLDGSGVRVLDIEVVRIKPEGPGDVLPLLEAGAALGAQYVICTVEDTDPVRRAEQFAAFCSLAASVGLRANLEYMIFSAVPSLDDARELVARSGGSAAILVDPLHHERAGGRPEQLSGLPMSLAPYVQLCDAAPAGAAADAAAARSEAALGRRLPGDGELPLVDLLARLDPSTGVSVEVPLPGQRRPDDPAAHAAHVRAAAMRVLGDRARSDA